MQAVAAMKKVLQNCEADNGQSSDFDNKVKNCEWCCPIA